MAKSRIAIIVGSNRRDSINRKGSRPLLSTDQPSLGQCVSVSLIESGDLSWAQSLHVGGHRR